MTDPNGQTYIRDVWNPFGMRDRGFMLLFGVITATLYVLFAFASITYATLLERLVQLLQEMNGQDHTAKILS